MSISFTRANLTDKSLNLANFNRMVDYIGRLANMSSPNILIDRGPTGYVLKVLPSSTTIDYSDFAFGYSISGARVTVNSGKVRHGVRAPITVAETAVTIAADQTWIYVEHTFGAATAIVTSSLVEPIMTATTLRYPLHLWGLSGGKVSVARILHLGDIIIPGVFA